MDEKSISELNALAAVAELRNRKDRALTLLAIGTGVMMMTIDFAHPRGMFHATVGGGAITVPMPIRIYLTYALDPSCVGGVIGGAFYVAAAVVRFRRRRLCHVAAHTESSAPRLTDNTEKS